MSSYSVSDKAQQMASTHAGRQLIVGMGEIRERDVYQLSVDGKIIKEGWEWIKQNRPDLAKYGSLEGIHEQLAMSRWLTLNHPTSKVVLRRKNGARTDYRLDWFTISTLFSEESIGDIGNLIESGSCYQELQLRSPEGEVLARYEARRLDYKKGSYPTGNYIYTEEMPLRPTNQLKTKYWTNICNDRQQMTILESEGDFWVESYRMRNGFWTLTEGAYDTQIFPKDREAFEAFLKKAQKLLDEKNQTHEED